MFSLALWIAISKIYSAAVIRETYIRRRLLHLLLPKFATNRREREREEGIVSFGAGECLKSVAISSSDCFSSFLQLSPCGDGGEDSCYFFGALLLHLLQYEFVFLLKSPTAVSAAAATVPSSLYVVQQHVATEVSAAPLHFFPISFLF